MEFINYCYKIKAINNTAKIGFNQVLLGIKKHVDVKDLFMLKECSNWLELLETVETYKIKAKTQIRHSTKTINQGKPVPVEQKKTVKCYICGEEGHISPNCTKKKKELNTIFIEQNSGQELTGVIGTINNQKIFMVLDTGATGSFLPKKLTNKLGISGETADNMWIKCASNKKAKICGKVKLKIQLGSVMVLEEFYIVEDLKHDAFLGATFAIKNGLK